MPPDDRADAAAGRGAGGAGFRRPRPAIPTLPSWTGRCARPGGGSSSSRTPPSSAGASAGNAGSIGCERSCGRTAAAVADDEARAQRADRDLADLGCIARVRPPAARRAGGAACLGQLGRVDRSPLRPRHPRAALARARPCPARRARSHGAGGAGASRRGAARPAPAPHRAAGAAFGKAARQGLRRRPWRPRAGSRSTWSSCRRWRRSSSRRRWSRTRCCSIALRGDFPELETPRRPHRGASGSRCALRSGLRGASWCSPGRASTSRRAARGCPRSTVSRWCARPKGHCPRSPTRPAARNRLPERAAGWPAPKAPASAIDDAELDLALLEARPRSARKRAAASPRTSCSRIRTSRARCGRARAAGSSAGRPPTASCNPGPTRSLRCRRQQLAARAYSPTALQNYAACPYKFVLQAIHRLSPQGDARGHRRDRSPLARLLDPRGAVQVPSRRCDASGGLPIRDPGAAQEVLERVIEDVARKCEDDLAPAIPRVWSDCIAGVKHRSARVVAPRLRGAGPGRPGDSSWHSGLREREERDPHSTAEPVALDEGIRCAAPSTWWKKRRTARFAPPTTRPARSAREARHRHRRRAHAAAGALCACAGEALSRLPGRRRPALLLHARRRLHLGAGRARSGAPAAACRSLPRRSRRPWPKASCPRPRATRGECEWCDYLGVCGPERSPAGRAQAARMRCSRWCGCGRCRDRAPGRRPRPRAHPLRTWRPRSSSRRPRAPARRPSWSARIVALVRSRPRHARPHRRGHLHREGRRRDEAAPARPSWRRRASGRRPATSARRLTRALARARGGAASAPSTRFCADLLRERPVEARVDPLFEVAAGRSAGTALRSGLRRLVPARASRIRPRACGGSCGAKPAAAMTRPRELLRDAGVGSRRAPRLRRRLAARAVRSRRRRSTRWWRASASWPPMPPLAQQPDDWARASPSRRSPAGSRSSAGASRRAARDHDGLEAELHELARRALVELARHGRVVRAAASQRADGRPRCATQVKAELDAFLRACRRRSAPPACARSCGRSSHAYEGLKASAPASSTSSISCCAPAICCATMPQRPRASCRQRFTHIFVDEFQDTDPLQAEILLLLAADDPARDATGAARGRRPASCSWSAIPSSRSTASAAPTSRSTRT